MPVCTQCNAKAVSGTAFCGECGAQLPKSVLVNKCQSCGTVAAESATFCGECGKALLGVSNPPSSSATIEPPAPGPNDKQFLFGSMATFLVCWLVSFLITKSPWALFVAFFDPAGDGKAHGGGGEYSWLGDLLAYAIHAYETYHALLATLLLIATVIGTLAMFGLITSLCGLGASVFKARQTRS